MHLSNAIGSMFSNGVTQPCKVNMLFCNKGTFRNIKEQTESILLIYLFITLNKCSVKDTNPYDFVAKANILFF